MLNGFKWATRQVYDSELRSTPRDCQMSADEEIDGSG